MLVAGMKAGGIIVLFLHVRDIREGNILLYE